MIKNTVISVWLFVVLGIIACNSTKSNTNDSDSLLQTTKNDVATDYIVVDTTIYPTDSGYMAKILPVGTFHNDEVNPDDAQKKWFGLFRNGDKYYLKQTFINITNVYDPVLDQENEATGWEVTTENKDTCLILIEHLAFLTNRNIESISLPKNEILPNDTVTLDYRGRKYNIYATGINKEGDISDYKLYLTDTTDSQKHKTLLVATPFFEDKMINIIFAGDIDGDNILDLIIDTSNHYNGQRLVLYLSKPSANHQLITPIGMHLSVGC